MGLQRCAVVCRRCVEYPRRGREERRGEARRDEERRRGRESGGCEGYGEERLGSRKDVVVDLYCVPLYCSAVVIGGVRGGERDKKTGAAGGDDGEG